MILQLGKQNLYDCNSGKKLKKRGGKKKKKTLRQLEESMQIKFLKRDWGGGITKKLEEPVESCGGERGRSTREP